MENSLSPPAAWMCVFLMCKIYLLVGEARSILAWEMEYVLHMPPCLPVATLCSWLIGNSTGEQTGTSHFWTCLASKHIWLHLYLSKCDLCPDLLFGKGPIQSEVIGTDLMSFLSQLLYVQVNKWLDRTIGAQSSSLMSWHLYLVFSWWSKKLAELHLNLLLHKNMWSHKVL